MDPEALDRHITGGMHKAYPADVTCWNPQCVNYGEWQTVGYEEEYGAAWYTPEECPNCGGEWHEEEAPTKGEDQP